MFNLVVVMLISLLVLMFIMVSFNISLKNMSMSPYECGFSEVKGSRKSFSFRFFLISILFLVFDVEIILMLVVPLVNNDIFMFYNFFLFIFVLLCGVVYEIYQGAISWMN